MSQTTDDALSDPFEQTTYGKTAYQTYLGLMENDKDDFSWAMLTFAMSLMAYDDEMRIALARYALSGAPYNREIFAMGTFGFTKHARTLTEWLRLVERKRGVDAEARRAIADFVKEQARRAAEEVSDMSTAPAAEKLGPGAEPAAGMAGMAKQPRGSIVTSAGAGPASLPVMSVREWAERPLPLDMLRTMEFGEAVARLGKLSEDTDTAAEAVRGLALLPDSNSGKWLRRVCRNSAIAPEVQTKALLAMRGIGVTGNVKVVKLGNEYTVDLDDPQLRNDLPPELMQVYDWVAVWMLRAEGFIGDEEFSAHAERGEPFPQHLFDKTRVVFASPAMETVNRWLMDYYYYAFPALPTIAAEERRSWGEALLSLLEEASARGEADFAYEAPSLSEAGQAIKARLVEAIGSRH